jgi:hypothetical protein
MVDTLYYVGRADTAVPRVGEVKRLYGLDALIPADFERATLTAVDSDALRSLKEALVQAKQLWGQIVAGAAETAKFQQEISLARETAARLHARPLIATIDAIRARHTISPSLRPLCARASASKWPRRCCSSTSVSRNCRRSNPNTKAARCR